MAEPKRPRGAPIWVVVLLVVLVVWLARALIRVENQHYAMFIGMCERDVVNPAPFWDCLATIQTRTGWWWHLYYALTSN